MSNLNNRKSLVSKSSKNYISRRLSHADVLHYAYKTWEGQEQVAENIASEATKMITEVYEKNPAFFGNKSRKWILGGLFYLFGQKDGQPKTQKQIARSLNTNEMTIRVSYRNWLKYLPELTPKDIVNNSQRIRKLI